MRNSSTISSKGQITVPQEIRNRIGVHAGDRVEFIVEDGRVVICPLRCESNPFEKYRGILKHFSGRKEINAWIGEMRDEESRHGFAPID
jgi:antitoxin PrlF